MNKNPKTEPLFTLNGEQKFQLSLSMKQSLDILQMPIDELVSWVENAIETNPLLDWEPSFVKKNFQPIPIDIAHQDSLFEFLMKQAKSVSLKERSFKQIEWLIGNLDATGFFTQSLQDLPEDWKEEELLQLLEHVQQLEPPGVGARDVKESLLIQLKALGKENQICYQLIQEDFELLLEKKFSLIKRKYKIDEETFEKLILADLSLLDPFPGLRFQKSTSSFISPDLFFIQEGDSWRLEINEEKVPAFTLSSIPFSLLRTEEEKHFCKERLGEGKQLLLALKKRSSTLYAVAKVIVETQIEYLKEESSSLKALTIKEIAEKVGLHESTVARTVHHKSIACPFGVVPLKTLLSHSLQEDVSTDKAQKLLLKLVAEENKKQPLSDRELLEKMKHVGVECSRRTVTKYRNTLKIPSRRLRKGVPLY